ncbi:MAG: hypothetical protein AABY93_17135 [Bacteroidota bacterium]
MPTVIKTTFEQEQADKDEAFLKLTPMQSLERAYQVRLKMRKEGVNYSYRGQKVKVIRDS